MDPFENPFRPGAGTTPLALVGRDALIQEFGVTLRRAIDGRPGKGLVPIGLRGVGKTVLLTRFEEIARQEGAQAIAVEATEGEGLAGKIAIGMRRIAIGLNETKASKVAEKALRVLKSFTLTLDGIAFSLDVDALQGEGDSGDLSHDLTDLLVAVGRACREKKTGLLVSIDEIQYLSKRELSAAISAFHRSTQLDLPVVLAGAGLPQLPGLTGEAKSYSERMFEFPEVGPLEESEAKVALADPARENGACFTPEALDRISERAEGYPYFLQEWGHAAWNVAAGSPISLDDVKLAEKNVIDSLDETFFRVRFDRLTPKEKEYLRAMAELGAGPHRSGDIAAELRVKVESVAPRRSALIRKGMIFSPAHGDTAFTAPLFHQYLRRAMP